MTLTEVGIDDSRFGEMAEHAVHSGGLPYAWIGLERNDMIEIFKMCL